ncbi:malate dehydrogenase, mitochondrial [Folsomia candida]|uniref:malate dehydrogenase, mitochondrial n=1 Tax=Folsomia candida TaxID=158441 RepID=UPI000B8FA165|nr:malate dehydrogenase, mitochondrial [Folsomia candida]
MSLIWGPIVSRNVFPRIIPASSAKNFSSTTNLSTKIAVLGACGGIGQPLSLLLKMNPRVHELAMYDIQYPQGVASDLSHVPSPCAVQGFGAGQIMEALKDAKIVVCAAGSPRKAGVTREEQFRINSKVVKELAKSCSIMNPHAIYCIVTNPINSTVPLFCEIFKRAGVLNEGKILGISNLGMMRASSYIAKEKGWKPSSVSCPVIGGHSGITIVPIISQCKPDPQLSPEQVKLVTHEIREAGAEIVAAKKGAGTVALSIAWSAHKFIDSLLRAVDGEKGIVETAYVKGSVAEVNYFSNPVELGPEGVVKNLGLPQLNDYEKSLLNDCIPALTQHIRAGEGAATDSRPNLVPNAMVL